MEKTFVHVPYGDPGKGMYGAMFGKTTQHLVDTATDQLVRLAKSVPFSQKESVFNIGDYGTADGSASMEIIRTLLICLKEHHGNNTQFQIIYEDQPSNDFNSLFRRLSGIIPEPPSYLQDMDNVYALASGTSFYKQCLPSDSMHVILSTTAVHWLSTRPVAYENSVCCIPDSSEEEKQLLRQQVARDWQQFLLLRSKELKPGGLIMIVTACRDEEADSNWELYLNKSLPILNSIWKTFRDEGNITKEEFLNTNLDLCYHTMTQLKAPFENENTPVVKAHLRLLSAEVKYSDMDFLKFWRCQKEKEGIDDRYSFARSLTNATRAYTNSAFLGGLMDTRSPDEKVEIVDQLFRHFHSEILNIHPEDLKDELRFAYLFIEKLPIR